MTDRNPFDALGTIPPRAANGARDKALALAMAEYDASTNSDVSTQGSGLFVRLISGACQTWRNSMNTKSISGPAFATLLLVPVAGMLSWSMLSHYPAARLELKQPAKPALEAASPQKLKRNEENAARLEALVESEAKSDDGRIDSNQAGLSGEIDIEAPAAAPAPMELGIQAMTQSTTRAIGQDSLVGAVPVPSEPMPEIVANRDRIGKFTTNPVKRVAQEPISTFSIDADTASYAFARRALRDGYLPDVQSVRVEEMINYFPYEWPAPKAAATPFNTLVTVTPSPWNQHTRLMHIAIKGFEVTQNQKPKTNLVFLVDTSGSMQDQDKLPLVKASLRLLLERLGPDDSVGLVAYAGEAGVVLEPTKASQKARILAAIESLGSGGSTAGAAGIEEAYRLAESGFIKNGVNRVMLATDGDFNVGPSDDAALKQLIEAKRKSGVFLSVLGFGQGNYNDQMMQVLAQNGNGTAAYIDTLAEAEKTLVQEAGSTLFTIAKDVKIQVEFNPDAVSEYRLVGYETRALANEDFNNDRVDAGEIGSGHSVTAIYELTPKGGRGLSVDALRYGEKADAAGKPASSEYAFVKIRYKLPGGETSQLISQPVTPENVVGDLATAPQDVRFSIAVAAFGQKLRNADATFKFGYDAIGDLASGAKGKDEFGYRAEFLTLVRLAAALDTNR